MLWLKLSFHWWSYSFEGLIVHVLLTWWIHYCKLTSCFYLFIGLSLWFLFFFTISSWTGNYRNIDERFSFSTSLFFILKWLSVFLFWSSLFFLCEKITLPLHFFMLNNKEALFFLNDMKLLPINEKSGNIFLINLKRDKRKQKSISF